MRILCIGDVVGAAGCDHLRRVLPGIKRMYGIDVCVVNGENAAEGNGLLPQSAAHIFDSGADVITTGNHVFRRRELYETLDREPLLLRPANYPSSAPGRGWCTVDRGRYQVTVINLLGLVYLEALGIPSPLWTPCWRRLGTPNSVLLIFMQRPPQKKRPWPFTPTGAFPPWWAPTPMYRRRMNRSCPEEPAFSPIWA